MGMQKQVNPIDSVDRCEVQASIVADGQVSMQDLPDGGVRINARPRKHEQNQIPLACLIGGLVCMAIGWFGRGIISEAFPDSSFHRAPYILLGLGAANVMLFPLFILIRIITGPNREANIEIWDHRFRADRFVCGNHVISNYAPDDVLCVFVDDNALWLSARKGEVPLVAFGKRDVNMAIALLIASRLWSGRQLFAVSTEISGVKRWMVGPDPTDRSPPSAAS